MWAPSRTASGVTVSLGNSGVDAQALIPYRAQNGLDRPETTFNTRAEPVESGGLAQFFSRPSVADVRKRRRKIVHDISVMLETHG